MHILHLTLLRERCKNWNEGQDIGCIAFSYEEEEEKKKKSLPCLPNLPGPFEYHCFGKLGNMGSNKEIDILVRPT